MKIKNFYGRGMRLIHGESDPNFAEFLKAEGGSQSSPDEDPIDDNNDGNQPLGNNVDDNQEKDVDDGLGDNEEDTTPKPDQTISMLQEQISNLTGMVTNLIGNKEESTPAAPEPEVSIFESEDYDALAEGMAWDSDEKDLMKSFLSKALESNSKRTLATALNDIPGLVNSSVTANQTHAEMRTNFFTDHSALKPVQKYVSEIASGIAAEYKSIGKKASIPEILTEAAKRSYENLGIKKVEGQSNGESRGGKPNPAFPKNRSNSRKPSPKTTKMQNDISAIMSLDN